MVRILFILVIMVLLAACTRAECLEYTRAYYPAYTERCAVYSDTEQELDLPDSFLDLFTPTPDPFYSPVPTPTVTPVYWTFEP